MRNVLKLIAIILSIFAILILIQLIAVPYIAKVETVNYIDKQMSKKVEIYGHNYPLITDQLDLSNIKIDDDILNKLELFQSLKEVNLKNNDLTVDLQIKLLKKFPNIDFDWDVSVLDKKVDSKIETLDLSNAKIDDLMSFKKSISILHNLKQLDLCDCNLSNETLASLREEFPNTKIVWKIYFSIWSLRTDAVSFSTLVGGFRYVYLTSETIQVFKYCTDLQALDLGHQKITDISVIGDYLPNLRVLILADNDISDITPIGKLKHLHYLELFMNRITDISPLASCKELVDLNLSFIPTLRDYTPLLTNDFPILERLWLVGGYIQNNTFLEVQKKYSYAKVSKTGPGSTEDGWRKHDRYFAMIDMFMKRNYISELFSMYDGKVTK